VGRAHREHDVGAGQQFGKVVKRGQTGLLGAMQRRFASAGAHPADLVAATDQTGSHGRTHGAGVKHCDHSLAVHLAPPVTCRKNVRRLFDSATTRPGWFFTS